LHAAASGGSTRNDVRQFLATTSQSLPRRARRSDVRFASHVLVVEMLSLHGAPLTTEKVFLHGR